MQHVAACYSMLQHVAACCSMLQHVAARCSTLQHVAERCSVLCRRRHTATIEIMAPSLYNDMVAASSAIENISQEKSAHC